MVNIKRWLRHAFMPPWRWRMLFPKTVLGDIEKAVKHSTGGRGWSSGGGFGGSSGGGSWGGGGGRFGGGGASGSW